MSDELITSLKPPVFIENKGLRQRQPQISQRTLDIIAISQEASRWGEILGYPHGKEILDTLLDRLDDPERVTENPERITDSTERKADFTETITRFLIRLYVLKLEHELILTMLKLIALLIAGLLYIRRLYRRGVSALTPLISPVLIYFRSVEPTAA
jgi:hypothetical protein